MSTSAEVHASFEQRIREVYDFMEVFASGMKVSEDRHNQIIKELQLEQSEQDPDKRNEHRHFALLWRMFLLYCISLLEEMLSSYAGLENHSISDKIEWTNRPSIGIWLDTSQTIEQAASKWQRWIQKRIRGLPDGIDADTFSAALKNAPMSDVLLDAIAIRNSEIHNSGIMNEGNHKLAPICKVGERVKWDPGLIYSLTDSLTQLNDSLSRAIHKTGV